MRPGRKGPGYCPIANPIAFRPVVPSMRPGRKGPGYLEDEPSGRLAGTDPSMRPGRKGPGYLRPAVGCMSFAVTLQ